MVNPRGTKSPKPSSVRTRSQTKSKALSGVNNKALSGRAGGDVRSRGSPREEPPAPDTSQGGPELTPEQLDEVELIVADKVAPILARLREKDDQLAGVVERLTTLEGSISELERSVTAVWREMGDVDASP